MIRLKQITTVYGETTLVFDVDFPDGSVRELRIQSADLTDRMRELKRLVGRELTVGDLRNVIVAVVNQMREGKKPLTERFDLSQYVGVDLEA